MDISSSGVRGSVSNDEQLSSCPICGLKFGLLNNSQRLAHLNRCMDSPAEPLPLANDNPSAASHSYQETSTNLCPTCGKDISNYTQPRRLQHANRCADNKNSVPNEDERSIRKALIPNSIHKRKKSTSPEKSSRAASNESSSHSLDPNKPPPTSMNMTDQYYICPICNHRLGGEFKSRTNHLASCAAKNNVDAEKLGQLKVQQEAQLIADRVAWEKAHPDFQRGDISTSQSPVAPKITELRSKTKRAKKKVTASAIAAHSEQLALESVLVPFFPSQLLDEHQSQDGSHHSHQLTWLSTSPSDTNDMDETITTQFQVSESAPPIRLQTHSYRLVSTSTNLKSLISDHLDSDSDSDAHRSTQMPKKSGLVISTGKTATVSRAAKALSILDDNVMDDDLFDVPLTQPAGKGEKRRAESDLPLHENGVKKPKLRENSTLAFVEKQTVIILDSPVNSQEYGKAQQVSESRSEDDDSVVDFGYKQPEIGVPITHATMDMGVNGVVDENKDSKGEEDDQYWMLPLSQRISIRRGSSPTKTLREDKVPMSPIEQPPAEEEEDEEDNEKNNLDFSPSTPPVELESTPPRSRRTSTADDFIDLCSPARVLSMPRTSSYSPLPLPLQPSDTSPSNENGKIESPPLVNTNPTTMNSLRPLPNSPTSKQKQLPLFDYRDDITPFHTELDAIIKKFNQLEKQAEEAYYATLGRLSIQRDQQVKQLASHFSVDMVAATRAFHVRSTKVSSTNTSINASPLRLTSSVPPTSNAISSTLLPNPIPISFGKSNGSSSLQAIRELSDDESLMSNQKSLFLRNPKSAAPSSQAAPTSTSTASTNSPKFGSGSNSTSTLVQPPSSNAIQRPNFESMNNSQIEALATKFGLQSNHSRTVLVSQLEAIWQHYKMQFSSGIEKSVPSSVIALQSRSSDISARLEAYTNLNPSSTRSSSTNAATTGTNTDSNQTSSVAPKRTRAKATRAAAVAPLPDSSRALAGPAPTITMDPTLPIQEKLDLFIKNDMDLYSCILHYTSIDVVELQAKLKESKIRCSRHDLQQYLQSRGALFTLKKTGTSNGFFRAKR
jgi:hypothetical protein